MRTKNGEFFNSPKGTLIKSTYTYFLEDGKKQKAKVDYFIMELNSSKRVKTRQMLKENLGGKWIKLSEAKNVVSFDNLREVLREARRRGLVWREIAP